MTWSCDVPPNSYLAPQTFIHTWLFLRSLQSVCPRCDLCVGFREANVFMHYVVSSSVMSFILHFLAKFKVLFSELKSLWIQCSHKCILSFLWKCFYMGSLSFMWSFRTKKPHRLRGGIKSQSIMQTKSLLKVVYTKMCCVYMHSNKILNFKLYLKNAR